MSVKVYDGYTMRKAFGGPLYPEEEMNMNIEKIRELNARTISYQEVRQAVNELRPIIGTLEKSQADYCWDRLMLIERFTQQNASPHERGN